VRDLFGREEGDDGNPQGVGRERTPGRVGRLPKIRPRTNCWCRNSTASFAVDRMKSRMRMADR
jgi:hypothetical protein